MHTDSLCTPTYVGTPANLYMTASTQIATPPRSTTSTNSNSSVQIQVKPQSQFEFVWRDTERSGVLDLEDFGSVAISSANCHIHQQQICMPQHMLENTYMYIHTRWNPTYAGTPISYTIFFRIHMFACRYI